MRTKAVVARRTNVKLHYPRPREEFEPEPAVAYAMVGMGLPGRNVCGAAQPEPGSAGDVSPVKPRSKISGLALTVWKFRRCGLPNNGSQRRTRVDQSPHKPTDKCST